MSSPPPKAIENPVWSSPVVPAVPFAAAVLSVGTAAYLITFPALSTEASGAGVVAWYLVLLWVGVGLVYHFFAGGRRLLASEESEAIEGLLGRPDHYERDRYRVFLPLKEFEDEDLLRLGALVARARDGELSLLNVVEIPRNLPPKALRFTYVDARIKGLQRLAREARRLGVHARATVKIAHRPQEVVLETMQEEAVNLLLLGMPRSRPGPMAAMGGTTDSLILGAPCDVAVARLAGMKESLRRIGVVLGPWASRGLPELARAVLSPGGHIAFLGLAADSASGETLRADAEKAVAACLADGIEASYQEIGPPSAATLQGIAAKDFDLLLLGSPEPKAFARAVPLIRQVRRLTCPVVIFRPAPS